MLMLICAITAWAIFLVSMYREWGWEWSTFFFSFIVALGGLLAGLLLCVFPMIHLSTLPLSKCQVDLEEQTELVALKDNFQMEGTAFLFSSAVNEDLKYTYVYETEMGKTTNSIPASDCYLNYVDENTPPYIQKWTVRYKSAVIDWLFASTYNIYTIYLPEGSIIENVYEVDLE